VDAWSKLAPIQGSQRSGHLVRWANHKNRFDTHGLPFRFQFQILFLIPTPTPSGVAFHRAPFMFPVFVRRGFGTAASTRIRNLLLQVLLHVRHRRSDFEFRFLFQTSCSKNRSDQIQFQGFLVLLLRNQDLVRLRIQRRLQDPLENPFPLEDFVPRPRILDPRS
jgi:hypothetical protein